MEEDFPLKQRVGDLQGNKVEESEDGIKGP